MVAPLGVSRVMKSLCGCRKTVGHLNWMRISKHFVGTASTTGNENLTAQGDNSPKVGFAGRKKAQEISQAMKYYLEVKTKQDQFMEEQIAAYEIGKRHLANIMGRDPDDFTYEDIQMAIEYLLPSGLFHRGARPKMKHPTRVLPKAASAQFDITGRPHDPFFYTGHVSFYNLMHTMDMKLEGLKAYEDKLIAEGTYVPGQHIPEKDSIFTTGSVPIDRKSGRFGEIDDEMYDQFVRLLQRLIDQPFADKEKKFIMTLRKSLVTQQQLKYAKPVKYDKTGRPYVRAQGQRKTCKVDVRVIAEGTGVVIINGKDLLDTLPNEIDRETLLAPLQMTGTLGRVDIVGAYTGPTGGASLAGALRLAVARALQSFVGPDVREKLRLAGLLTRDPRVRERKKPGQMKARRKYTWVKR